MQSVTILLHNADVNIERSSVFTIYNVNYVAYKNNNIVSIVIKATLKEGKNSQRVIIKTYNYDIEKKELVSLEELINKKNLKISSVQRKIKEEIQKVYNENLAFEQVGYAVFKRDKENVMYNIENTDTFFLDENNNLYILYPYGNNNYTSETDIIIF